MVKRNFYVHSMSAIEILSDNIGRAIDNSMKKRKKGTARTE